MLASVRAAAVPSASLLAVAARAAEVHDSDVGEVERGKLQALAEYRETESYKKDIVNLLQPSLQQAFAQVHDYRQLITQVIQNVNVILNQSQPGKDLDDQLAGAPKAVQSIYWAARLMEFKLESALFLVHPERIHDASRERSFRFHGAVMKYLAIYEPQMNAHRITHRENGQSFGHLVGNPDALGVIPHSFIDNAIKYAPDGSEIVLSFAETNESISFSVGSFGPRIAKDEQSHLFDLFFRGAAAQQSAEDGTGFGLGLAQHIADETGTRLSVDQDSKATDAGYFWTTFGAVFQKKSARDEQPSRLHRTRQRTRGGSPVA